jgi:hypothetical protein
LVVEAFRLTVAFFFAVFFFTIMLILPGDLVNRCQEYNSATIKIQG